MGKTTFSGPVQTGRDRGNPNQNSIGIAAATQVANVSSAITSASRVAVVPVPCRITNITFDVDVAFATTASAAAKHSLEVGISGDVNRFSSIGLSAVGRYDLASAVSGNSISGWRITASEGDDDGTIRILAKVSSPVTALDTGDGELIIEYRQE